MNHQEAQKNAPPRKKFKNSENNEARGPLVKPFMNSTSGSDNKVSGADS